MDRDSIKNIMELLMLHLKSKNYLDKNYTFILVKCLQNILMKSSRMGLTGIDRFFLGNQASSELLGLSYH